ncbi:RQC-minor-1 family DNA-binding protein [Aneurinibacillus terranovensis]|uniref:RQC-minor-1 family DNA-binding protein n=1 Tax=Aneurinibacillus terranovensis TaxID=278991 RepID=UPI00040D5E77|nr:RQC-minor-1 family DNA-binding protein [Aneurinibacillus terranovensis]
MKHARPKSQELVSWENNPSLFQNEIRLILRAADDIIASGGRTLLSKILKGSKEKKLLELGLEKNPSYGCFRSLTMAEIMGKIDWMIDHNFLEIQYSGKLPMIVFTERGWTIERDQYADELLHEWDQWIADGITDVNMEYLKDRNRGMILLFLQKIKNTGNIKYLPFLKQWEKTDYKKVRQIVGKVIDHLEQQREINTKAMAEMKEEVTKAFEFTPNEPEILKCWECGERFIFTVEEEKFFKLRGFVPPKRCPACREKKRLEELGVGDELEFDE